MSTEIPAYGLRAYALLFSRHGSREPFSQKDLDWMVKESMRKKIFAVLLNSGWIRKLGRKLYQCIAPEIAIKNLLEWRVPQMIKEAGKDYAFTGLSAIEIWSDFSYVQRGIEKSPYFIKILKKDLKYWKGFFNKKSVPNYVQKGSTIGEYVILIPVQKMKFIAKEGFKVDSLAETLKSAKENEMYLYAYQYIKIKYGTVTA